MTRMTNTAHRERNGSRPPRESAREFAVAAARIAGASKSEDVSVLDLRGLSNLADYFVIGTGTSYRQMHAVLDLIREHAQEVGHRHLHIGDASDASWLLADYVDVVIHLFDDEHRQYYDLGGLWGDAPRVPWESDDFEAPASDQD